MNPWFEIILNRDDGCITLRMGGFFQPTDIEDLALALTHAIERLGTEPNAHRTLCDITAMKIQTQESVAIFAGVVGSPKLRSAKLAFVTGATLARMQARRLTSRENVAFFDDVEQALCWLQA